MARKIKIYMFPGLDSGEVYDETQTNDKIHDGDILVVPDERIVGIQVEAWPVAVTREHGHLHHMKDGWKTDGLKTEKFDYTESYTRAVEVAKEQGYDVAD